MNADIATRIETIIAAIEGDCREVKISSYSDINLNFSAAAGFAQPIGRC